MLIATCKQRKDQVATSLLLQCIEVLRRDTCVKALKPELKVTWRYFACRVVISCQRAVLSRASSANSGVGSYDYDLLIIGCGVGGHGAALHAVEQVWHLSQCKE